MSNFKAPILKNLFVIWNLRFMVSFVICLPALPTGRQAQAGILTFDLALLILIVIFFRTFILSSFSQSF